MICILFLIIAWLLALCHCEYSDSSWIYESLSTDRLNIDHCTLNWLWDLKQWLVSWFAKFPNICRFFSLNIVRIIILCHSHTQKTCFMLLWEEHNFCNEEKCNIPILNYFRCNKFLSAATETAVFSAGHIVCYIPTEISADGWSDTRNFWCNGKSQPSALSCGMLTSC